MNPDRLLAYYDRVADAPDAVARLRRFVLDLAVRGKLVTQDPSEEPASALLQRIEAEKARLVKAGKIRVPKTYDLPGRFNTNIPAGWEVVPLGSIINDHLGGGTPSKTIASFWGGDIRWASVKDVGKSKYLDETIDRITEDGLRSSSSNLIPPGHLIVVTRMGLGQLSINRVPVAINQDLRALFLSSHLDIDFVYNVFLTNRLEGTGLTVKGIRLEELMTIPFPLPPLAEQRRIVARVEELMALLDRQEAARATREAARDRLTTASLAPLNAPNPETFREDVRLVLDALPALTKRPDQIRSLRRTILSLAVRGKLATQDPTDEPASELLARISNEKARLVQAGVLKVERAEKKPTLPQAPFQLPPGWTWARLQSLCLTISDGDHQAPPKAANGVPFLVIGDVKTKVINYDAERKVEQGYYDGLDPVRKPRAGDILYTLVGSFGIPVPVLSNEPFCVQRHIGILRPAGEIEQLTLALFLESDFAFKQADQAATGIAQKTVSLAGLRSMLLPVPPLPEQRRILAKVHHLMALCDKLESGITRADRDRARLLETLLYEALVPTSLSEAA